MGGTHFLRRLLSTRALLLLTASVATAALTVADGSGTALGGLDVPTEFTNPAIAIGDREVVNGGSITATVWLDADANGTFDETEGGLANTMVSLMRCDGSFVRAGFTDVDGSTTFGRVPMGCYRLRYNEMSGYRYCPTDIGDSDIFDSDANPTTGLTESFTVTNRFEQFVRYAGAVPVSENEIGDRVWEDANANGFQDMGEQGLANVQVNLLNCSGDAVLDQSGQPISTTSQADGSFGFGTLASGCYQLGFIAPADHSFSFSETPFESYDSDADQLSGITNPVDVTGVAAQLNLDAGLYKTARIGDWVWHDLDGNGVQNANEPGVEGIQVVLLDAGGIPLGNTVTTDADGYYTFTDIIPGNYRLQFAAPTGFSFSQFSATGDINLDSDANGLGVTPVFQVLSGANIQDKDVAVLQFNGANIGLEKLTNGADADLPPGPYVPAGDPVMWEYIVSNLGNEPFTNVQISDDQGVSVSCPQDTLDVGESITCTGSTDDAQAGQYVNTGEVCGTTSLGTTECNSDVSHYFGVDPAISIEKTTNGFDSDQAPGEFIVPGTAIVWEYVVVNTGNITLNDVIVIDNQGVDVSCPSMSLDPGVSMTCVGTGIAVAGQYSNIGGVEGFAPIGESAKSIDKSHYFGLDSGIDIEKSTNGVDADAPSGPIVYAGETVTWTYTVTNTGSVQLENVVVTDSDPSVSVSCPSDSLAPGASFECIATGTATSGQYDNQSVATGQGVDSNGDPVGGPVSDDDPSHYFGVDPSISIEKATNGEDADTPTGPSITEGDEVNWTYVVTNTGNTVLENVVVTDDQGVTVTCPQDTLTLGESMTCTASGTATLGQYMNLGTVVATGLDPDGEPLPPGPPITDDDPSHYIGESQATASLGDKVFKDLNGNGQQDADEPGIPGITVNLWTDDDGNGTPDTQLSTTTTDGDGMYGFADLDPDLTYVVQFVNDPAMNMPFTTPNVGDDATDSDAGPDGITGPIDLDPGENNPTIDAGVVNLPASLGDKVFKDLNSDGQQDADEPGVPGITVNLWTDDDGDGSPDTQISTTTTDGNGMYGFTDLDPTLTYVVQFVNDPAMNMPFTTPNVGDDATDSDANADGITGPINLASGENNPTIDAGIVNVSAGLGDKVFTDLNGNGQQDADEPGVPGITVNLWTDDDGDGSPDTQIATTTTDANGTYGFLDLDPTLTYVVQFVNDPAMNMPFTTPNVGDDATDSDAGPDGITGPITLTSGQNDPTIDAGLVNLPASLGDKVFKDLNSDGQQDADEPGIPG
ncbi:MAG: SdrD B-like domain-containing protein, partial [Gammaproteobacteria bacterium]